jgi:hypothetical protein
MVNFFFFFSISWIKKMEKRRTQSENLFISHSYRRLTLTSICVVMNPNRRWNYEATYLSLQRCRLPVIHYFIMKTIQRQFFKTPGFFVCVKKTVWKIQGMKLLCSPPKSKMGAEIFEYRKRCTWLRSSSSKCSSPAPNPGPDLGGGHMGRGQWRQF